MVWFAHLTAARGPRVRFPGCATLAVSRPYLFMFLHIAYSSLVIEATNMLNNILEKKLEPKSHTLEYVRDKAFILFL